MRAPERPALLHPDFREFGASGRVWDRASIVSVMSGTDARLLLFHQGTPSVAA